MRIRAWLVHSRVQHSPSKDLHKTLAIMMDVFSAPIVLYFIDQLKNFDKIHPCVIFVTVVHSVDIAHVTRAYAVWMPLLCLQYLSAIPSLPYSIVQMNGLPLRRSAQCDRLVHR
jgi:hypothetical protein